HLCLLLFCSFFFTTPATTVLYTLSLHDALPILQRFHLIEFQLCGCFHLIDFRLLRRQLWVDGFARKIQTLLFNRVAVRQFSRFRSEEHTSELQSLRHLVCRLLLEKKKNKVEKYN